MWRSAVEDACRAQQGGLLGVAFVEAFEAAVLEPEDAVGDVADAVVVGDDDDRAVLRLRDIVEELDDLVAVARVEVGRGFVGED